MHRRTRWWGGMGLGLVLGMGLAGCHGSGRVEVLGTYEATPDRRPEQSVAFRHHGTNPREDTRDRTTSTFGIDVDDASFDYARAELAAGRMPAPEMVRVEEFVNHVDYGYPLPGEGAVALHAEAAPSPFTPGAHLLRCALQAAETPAEAVRPRRLVFAVDASGSMQQEQRMSLVKFCVLHLVERLRNADTVTVVAFSDTPHVVLPETPVSRRDEIWAAVHGIVPRGPTDVVAGLAEAYAQAGRQQAAGVVTRVVLCSDGLANRATWDEGALVASIRGHAAAGVRLSVVGFGQDTYNDTHLELLAREGQGRYTHVADQGGIERSFGHAFLRAMDVVAEDVRVQVTFDPAVVRSWRLLGYESRHLRDDAFESRHVRAAHLEAGREVTAVYELRLHEGARGSVGAFAVAYRDPETGRARRAQVVGPGVARIPTRFDEASRELRVAACAAELAELLRGSVHARDHRYESVLRELEAVARSAWTPAPHRGDGWGSIDEMRAMVESARRLDPWRQG